MNRSPLKGVIKQFMAWTGVAVLGAVFAFGQDPGGAAGQSQTQPAAQQGTPADGQVEMDVVHALDASQALKNDLITAATIQGEVTLSGTVSSQASKQLAESITAHVDGVTKVHNNLTIGNPGAEAESPLPAPEQEPQVMTVQIDQNCRILPDRAGSDGHKRPHPYKDPTICHLEHVHSSEHWEEAVSGNQLLRSSVRIQEHEFALTNIADEPVLYVVQQTIPEGWVIDSDPQPAKRVGSTAYFNVYVQPGQTERLHVGMRHDSPQKPKPM